MYYENFFANVFRVTTAASFRPQPPIEKRAGVKSLTVRQLWLSKLKKTSI